MSVVEQANSRTITYDQGNPVGIREFYCYPYETEQAVIALMTGLPGQLPRKLAGWPGLYVGTPPVLLAFRDFDITRDPNVPQGWRVRLIYKDASGITINYQKDLQPNDDRYISVRLSTEGRFGEFYRQFDTDAALRAALNSKTDDAYRPLYNPASAQADIGGRKIDIAGTPATIVMPVQKMIVDITTINFPRLSDFTKFLGTRNLDRFLGIEPFTAVLMGADAQQMQPGRWIISLNIEVDKYYFLRQAPMRNAGGFVITDEGGETNALGRGQAKQVAWFQMYSEVSLFEDIHIALRGAVAP